MYTYVIDLQLQYAEFGEYFVCFLRQGLTIECPEMHSVGLVSLKLTEIYLSSVL